MHIELTKLECDQLIEALKAWEREPHTESMTSSLLGAMTAPMRDKSKEESLEEMKAELEKARRAGMKREEIVLFLRAKLTQYRNRLSEHDVEKE